MWCNIHICLCKCGQYRKHSVSEIELILTAHGKIEDSKRSHHLLKNIIYLYLLSSSFMIEKTDFQIATILY